jgi:hypothetical protein
VDKAEAVQAVPRLIQQAALLLHFMVVVEVEVTTLLLVQDIKVS